MTSSFDITCWLSLSWLLQVQRVFHGGDLRGADRGDDHHVRAGGRRAVGQPEHRRVHPASDGKHPLQT